MMNFLNKTVFITGGTGFIGTYMIMALLKQNATIICYGRNVSKIQEKFGDSVIAASDFNYTGIDYVIHAACPTQSSTLWQNPVEVIDTIYSLTKASLDMAKKNHARYIFLSSMEVYDGLDGKIDETNTASFNLSNSRTSYPLGKQTAELMVNSYHTEYGVDTCVLRLSNIFGPGLPYEDNRLFNYLIKCCIENRDVVLKTTGEKLHNSCYINDAVNLIIKLLQTATNETYNITNEDYCFSINDLAAKTIDILGSKSQVIHDIDDKYYPPASKHIISGEKLQKMFPTYKLETFENAIKNTAAYLRNLKSSHNFSS